MPAELLSLPLPAALWLPGSLSVGTACHLRSTRPSALRFAPALHTLSRTARRPCPATHQRQAAHCCHFCVSFVGRAGQQLIEMKPSRCMGVDKGRTGPAMSVHSPREPQPHRQLGAPSTSAAATAPGSTGWWCARCHPWNFETHWHRRSAENRERRGRRSRSISGRPICCGGHRQRQPVQPSRLPIQPTTEPAPALACFLTLAASAAGHTQGDCVASCRSGRDDVDRSCRRPPPLQPALAAAAAGAAAATVGPPARASSRAAASRAFAPTDGSVAAGLRPGRPGMAPKGATVTSRGVWARGGRGRCAGAGCSSGGWAQEPLGHGLSASEGAHSMRACVGKDSRHWGPLHGSNLVTFRRIPAPPPRRPSSSFPARPPSALPRSLTRQPAPGAAFRQRVRCSDRSTQPAGPPAPRLAPTGPSAGMLRQQARASPS